MNVVWAIKLCLVCSLFLFGIGLWLGISPTKRSKPADEEDAVFAADLLHFSEEIIASPPITDVEARAVVFYRLSKAVDELRAQNSAKNAKVRQCGNFFMAGLA